MHALAAVRREIRSQDPTSQGEYLREFHEAFQHFDTTLNPEQLAEKLSSAGILLVGDYHALPASQRFSSELLESLAHSGQVVLGVEAILSRDQDLVDSWWRREISEETLRQRLRFDREWGYEWAPFYDLLVSAREHAEAIYALDCVPRNDLRRIRSRDRHAALKIQQAWKEHPESKIVVLFGESHMAPRHLPGLLKEALPNEGILTILQNLDALYWQAAEASAKAVSLREDAICVFNSSPLEKYESYRLCLERWSADSDDGPDFAPAVYNVILSLARALGFRLNSPSNGRQPKFLADSLPEVVSGNAIPPGVTILEQSGCAYVPEENIFYVQEFQMPEVASEAARFLHWVCRGKTKPLGHAQTVENALAQFAGRLLCPETAIETGSTEMGTALYRAYIAGRITKRELRRMFMTHLEEPESLRSVIAAISSHCATS